MTDVRYGTICKNRHVRWVAESRDEIPDISHCENCGQKLHDSCPSCSLPIVVRKYEREDGTTTVWRVNDYCYECGEAYPWGPGRIGQTIDKFSPDLSGQSGPRPSDQILSSAKREYLKDTKYGPEVIYYLREGDRCYKSAFWLAALTQYTHAIEWSAIAYLEAEADLDVIEEEREGINYYMAGGEHSIVDEIEKRTDVDQKTVSYINTVNRLERRWVAHHKSGKTHREDVDSLRARLGTLVDSLFGPIAKKREGPDDEQGDN